MCNDFCRADDNGTNSTSVDVSEQFADVPNYVFHRPGQGDEWEFVSVWPSLPLTVLINIVYAQRRNMAIIRQSHVICHPASCPTTYEQTKSEQFA